jgi:predicted anti-sigma-YlaC factor YlaD
MLTPVPPTDCMQAREGASLRLDGELSELGAVRLGLHLRDCAPCRAYTREIAAIALELRSSPLEQPRTERFVQRHRRRSGLGIQAAAVAAVGLVAAVAGSSFAIGKVVGDRERTTTVLATSAPDAPAIRADSNQQHVLAMLRGTVEPDRPSSGKVIPL